MKALVVIDMQEDFINGPLGTPEARAIVPKIAEKVRQYLNDEEETGIIYTRDTHFDNYLETDEGQKLPVPHCILGTSGHNIVPEVYVEGNSKAFNKYAFGDLSLPDRIQSVGCECWDSWEVDSLEIVGVCTDICVISNALILRAAYRGIPIVVDSSCCAGTTPAAHEAALTVMKSCQIEVI